MLAPDYQALDEICERLDGVPRQEFDALPKGRLCEGALNVLFEMPILSLREHRGAGAAAMRANLTNRE